MQKQTQALRFSGGGSFVFWGDFLMISFWLDNMFRNRCLFSDFCTEFVRERCEVSTSQHTLG